MPRRTKPLTALEVKRITQRGVYAAGEVPGLYLQVAKTGTQSWVMPLCHLRNAHRSGKPFKVRRDMGLGSYPGVTLAQAREKARTVRDKLEAGIDPVTGCRAFDQSRRAAELACITDAPPG